MTITWIKCSERMPFGNSLIIVRDGDRTRHKKVNPHELIDYKNLLCRSYGTNDMFNSENWEWTPYTPEAWNSLNRKPN